MHWHDGTSAVGNKALDKAGIHVQRILTRLAQHRNQSVVTDS